MIRIRKPSMIWSFRRQFHEKFFRRFCSFLGLSPIVFLASLRFSPFFSVLPNQNPLPSQLVAEHGRLPFSANLRNATTNNQSIQITATPRNHKQRWISNLLPSPLRAMPLRPIRTPPPWPRSPERPRRPGRPTTLVLKLRR